METERNERWSRWASIATVLAALFAIVTFAWSAKTELDTARAQAQATTLEILQAQMQLAVEHPEYATGDTADPAILADPRYGWFAMNALLTADTVYALVGDDPEWRQSAAMLVAQHQPFVRSPEFPCDVFNAGFLAFVREQTQDPSLCPGR
jgi:hypothetical protein